MRIVTVCLSLWLASFASIARALPNGEDLAILNVTSPSAGQLVHPNSHTAISLHVVNNGVSTSDESHLVVSIRNSSNVSVYADSVAVSALAPGEQRYVSLSTFVPAWPGYYTLTATLSYGSDPDGSNNTETIQVGVASEMDVLATNVFMPPMDTIIRYGSRWSPRARFVSHTAVDISRIPVGVLARQSSSGTLVFQADTILDDLSADSTPKDVTYPSQQGTYDITKLTPEVYTCAAIARYPTDGDRSNDTTYSSFVIAVPNDAVLSAILSPVARTTYEHDTTVSVTVRVKNGGINALTGATLLVTIRDQTGTLVYRDSSSIPRLPSQRFFQKTLSSFNIHAFGIYTIQAIAISSLDEWRLNDTSTIQIYRGFPRDAAVSIVRPTQSSHIIDSGWWGPTVRVQNVGCMDINGLDVRTTLAQCDSPTVLLYFDTTLSILACNGAPVEFTYGRQFTNGILYSGCYTVEAVAAYSHATRNITYQLAHDVAVDSIQTPAYLSSISSDSVPIFVSVHNYGAFTDTCNLTITTETRSNKIVDEINDVIVLAPNEYRRISYGPRFPKAHGTLWTYASINAVQDQQSDNDRVSTLFYWGKSNLDVGTLATSPRAGQRFSSSSQIAPSATIEWRGNAIDSILIPMRFVIHRVADGSSVYERRDSVALYFSDPSKVTLTFPHYSDLVPTPLAPGSYEAMAVAELRGDWDASDDTMRSTFTITSADVIAHAESGPFMFIFAKDGNELSVSSPDGVAPVHLDVVDVLGRSVFSTSSEPGAPVSVHLNQLAAGQYYVRITQAETSQLYPFIKN